MKALKQLFLVRFPSNIAILLKDKDRWAEVLRLIDTMAIQYVTGIRNILVESHQKNFFLAEIRALSAFFLSPIGKMYAKKSEVITQDLVKGIVGLQQRIIDTAIAAGAELMRKRKKESQL